VKEEVVKTNTAVWRFKREETGETGDERKGAIAQKNVREWERTGEEKGEDMGVRTVAEMP